MTLLVLMVLLLITRCQSCLAQTRFHGRREFSQIFSERKWPNLRSCLSLGSFYVWIQCNEAWERLCVWVVFGNEMWSQFTFPFVFVACKPKSVEAFINALVLKYTCNQIWYQIWNNLQELYSLTASLSFVISYLVISWALMWLTFLSKGKIIAIWFILSTKWTFRKG